MTEQQANTVDTPDQDNFSYQPEAAETEETTAAESASHSPDAAAAGSEAEKGAKPDEKEGKPDGEGKEPETYAPTAMPRSATAF